MLDTVSSKVPSVDDSAPDDLRGARWPATRSFSFFARVVRELAEDVCNIKDC
jgi:hypothetical protein